MKWPLTEDQKRILGNVRIDRIGWIAGIVAFVALLILTSLSVAGKIQPPVEILRRGEDITDEELLAHLLVFGAAVAVVLVWVKFFRSDDAK